MSSKLAQFLADKNIDPRRLIVASRQIERMRPADRRIRLAKRQKKEEGDQPLGERRSGRPVTQRLVSEASAGKKLSGPAKNRLLRAVNRVLEQKKQDPTDLRSLF